MRSLKKIKILLDSTYLLPILGVEVVDVRSVLIVLKKLYDKDIAIYYYTPLNIFEALGVISKTNYDYSIVAKGLKAITENFIEITPSPEEYLYALELKKKGFKDLIDLILYSVSLKRNIFFLTRDETLIDFIKRNNGELRYILFEKDFFNKYKDI